MNAERIFMQSLATRVQSCGKPVENYAEGNLRKKSRQKLFWLLPAEKYALTRTIWASREPQI